MHHQDEIVIETTGRGFTDVTTAVQRVVGDSGATVGLCTVFIRHTSASLVIQENADPAVLRDLARWMAELAPESRAWEHADEGPDDMPAHIRSALTDVSLSVPVAEGRPVLGTWQGIYLFEHRVRPHRRNIVLHLSG